MGRHGKRKIPPSKEQRRVLVNGVTATFDTPSHWNDLVFLVEGERVRASGILLSSSCEYFSAMLSGRGWIEGRREEIKVEGVSASTFRKVLLFLYSGSANFGDVEEAWEVLCAGDMFGVQLLCEECIHCMKRLISKGNCLSLLDAADKLPEEHCKKVVKTCFFFLDNNWKEVFGEVECLVGYGEWCLLRICDWVCEKVVGGEGGEELVYRVAKCIFEWGGGEEGIRKVHSLSTDQRKGRQTCCMKVSLPIHYFWKGRRSPSFKCGPYTMSTRVNTTLLGVGVTFQREGEPLCPHWWKCHVIAYLKASVILRESEEEGEEGETYEVIPIKGLEAGRNMRHGHSTLLTLEAISKAEKEASAVEVESGFTLLTMRSLLQANLFLECSVSLHFSKKVSSLGFSAMVDLQSCLSSDHLFTSEDNLLLQIVSVFDDGSPHAERNLAFLLTCVRWRSVSPSLFLELDASSKKRGGKLHTSVPFREAVLWVAGSYKSDPPLWLCDEERKGEVTFLLMATVKRDALRHFNISL